MCLHNFSFFLKKNLEFGFWDRRTSLSAPIGFILYTLALLVSSIDCESFSAIGSLRPTKKLIFRFWGRLFPLKFHGNPNSLPPNRKINFFVGRSDPIAPKLSQSIELTSRARVYNINPIGAL